MKDLCQLLSTIKSSRPGPVPEVNQFVLIEEADQSFSFERYSTKFW